LSSPIRVVIVGCGGIALNHAEAFAGCPDADLVACCDRDPIEAAAFAAAHGVPTSTDSLDDLLGEGVDAIAVCTPHHTHGEIVVAAAERGVHVLCEKPMALDVATADRMIAAIDEAA
jgi:UDP-N-acetyl-2-amino-2-deoxyglucuronate dehydrogenase